MYIKNKVIKGNLHLDTLMDRIVNDAYEEKVRTEYEQELNDEALREEMATRLSPEEEIEFNNKIR